MDFEVKYLAIEISRISFNVETSSPQQHLFIVSCIATQILIVFQVFQTGIHLNIEYSARSMTAIALYVCPILTK